MGFITALSTASLNAKVWRFRFSHGSRGSLPPPEVVAQAETVRAINRAKNRRICILDWIPAFAGMTVIAGVTSGRVNESHGQVQGVHVLRERAHRDAVDAGLGDGADVVQRDAAGGFEFRAAGGDLHGFAHAGEVE